MISNKKASTIRLLQLALALSLLQADPENFRNWDTQLELRDGNGWELEMLRAVPMAEYPYANRKTMMPLIEDLIWFDRQHDAHNRHNVTAYLLNVQTNSSDQTAAVQELQAPTISAPLAAAAPTTTAPPPPLEQAAAMATTTVSPNAHNASAHAELHFLPHSDHGDSGQDQRPMWEQNLADLQDFGDLPLMNMYSGLPLKDEMLDPALYDVSFEAYMPSFLDVAANVFRSDDAVEEQAEHAIAAVPLAETEIKVEPIDSGNASSSLDGVASCSASVAAKPIKKEPTAEPEIEIKTELDTETDQAEVEIKTEPSAEAACANQVELTSEESEIVEVLWKQDVDLGFSLNSADFANASDPSGSGANCDVYNDDIEKLKALEELKQDKGDFDGKDDLVGIGDEWAGIPYSVDNETGEYIRLPLDELLDDVLQLAELTGNSIESNSDDSIASTSKGAAASNTKTQSKGEDDNDNKENNNSKDGKLSDDDDLTQAEIEEDPIAQLFDLDDEAKQELADFDKMIQSSAPPFHHHHHHHHPHRPTATNAAAGVQNYAVGGSANSAFHRQATGFHHGHHQGRMPLSRGVSMEQRLQDIASLFNPIPSMGVVGGVSEMSPYPHYPAHHYSYQSAAGIPAPPQHGQYPPPPPPPHHHHHGHHAMLHPNATLGDICASQPHYGHNLGTAVSSSMHLTNVNHEADMGAGATGGAYKLEHDMMYYSNASSDMNHTTDGFINSILNDEDLHLMDMNVNESFCRMVDVNSTSNNSSVLGLPSSHPSSGVGSGASSSTNGLAMNSAATGAAGGMATDLMNSGAQNGDRLDASSDSAVSSMGSERVPSLSDGEWGEGSDSAQDYHQGKYGGPYDYSYNNGNSRLTEATRQPPVAQKKHQMFGKRYLHEQPGVGAAATGATATGGGAPAVNGLMHSGPAQAIKYEFDPYPVGMHQNGIGGSALGEGAIGPALSKEESYEMKYGAAASNGYSLDFSVRPPRNPHEMIQHNHTYHLPQGTVTLPRPQQRDKKLSSSSSKSSKSSGSAGEEEHLTRDEKRARALNIPIEVNDIINLPMDEFNERLSKYDLSENQLSLIRDIRRRGKNKVAAQNCRKRKLDQILSLEDEVKEVRRRKDQLTSERESLAVERKRISNKFAALHRHIFQYLRDADGNPCSSSEYSLQQAADGSIYLLPRDSNNKQQHDVSLGAVGGGGPGSANNNSNVGNVNHGSAPHPHHPHIAAPQHTHQPQQPPPQHPLGAPHTQHTMPHPHQAQQQPPQGHHHQAHPKD